MYGEMRERSIRAVSKTVVPQGTGGSNPPLSVFLTEPYSSISSTNYSSVWRDVRVVEGTRLEVVCARKGTEGSNPSLSVPGPMQRKFFKPRQIRKEAAVD